MADNRKFPSSLKEAFADKPKPLRNPNAPRYTELAAARERLRELTLGLPKTTLSDPEERDAAPEASEEEGEVLLMTDEERKQIAELEAALDEPPSIPYRGSSVATAQSREIDRLNEAQASFGNVKEIFSRPPTGDLKPVQDPDEDEK